MLRVTYKRIKAVHHRSGRQWRPAVRAVIRAVLVAHGPHAPVALGTVFGAEPHMAFKTSNQAVVARLRLAS